MGISSYTCAKTNLPIIVIGEARYHGKNLDDILLFPGPSEDPIPGQLGQYATFHSRKGTLDLLDSGLARKIERGEAKFALRDFLQPGDGFETIGLSHLDPGQGGLTYEDGFLSAAVRAGGFKSFLGLELAHSKVMPLKTALEMDETAAANYFDFEERIAAGWESGTLEILPGKPEIGIPGTIGKFYRGALTPLNSRCTSFKFHPYGDPRPEAETFMLVDGKFAPDPQAYAHDLASRRGLGRERTAIFEAEDGSASYVVKVYGDVLYTVEGTDYPLKAFVQINHALNTIGYDLAYPASLAHVDPDAGMFFSPWGKEEDKPETGVFTLPSAFSAPRP